MNCDWTRDNVVLYIYDELADDAKFEFEHHVRHCLECRKELESARAFKEEMATAPVQEISPNLLAASRMKLQESLEHAEQSRGLGRFVFDFAGWMHQLKLAPALTAALLMLGFAAGALTTYKIAAHPEQFPGKQEPPVISSIAGIESIVPDAGSNTVSIKYDTLHPVTITGAPDDPNIQRLLLLASRTPQDTGTRLTSIDVLTRKPEDNEIREALIYALRYDKNPGVRLKALDGLRDFVRDDVHVRDAVLEALVHDSNPGVRSEAISLLNPVRADMTVRDTLQELADHDQSKFIRAASRRVLASTPNLD